MKTTTRTEGILPGARDGPRRRGTAPAAGRDRRGRRAVAGRAYSSCSGFSGRGDKDLAALERFADVEPWSGRRDDDARTADVPTRRRVRPDRRTPRRARTRPPARGGSPPPSPGPSRGPRRAHPVRRRRLSGRRRELRDRARRGRRRAPTCSRSACRTRTRWPTARRSSARRASRSPPARRWSGRSALIERIGAARPDLPARADGLCQPGHRRRRRRRPSRGAWPGPGAAGLIVADLTPDEGAPFEAVAREAGLAVVYLVAPTTPPDRRAAIAARSGGFLYCVSLVGVTGARTSLPSTVGAPRPRRREPCRPSRSPSGSASAGRPMSGRSRRPERMASSSPRRSSMRSARMAATSPAWRASSASCVRPPESMGHHGHMATFDERAKDWDTPERIARAGEAADAIRANVPLASTDRVRRHRGRDRSPRPGAARRHR